MHQGVRGDDGEANHSAVLRERKGFCQSVRLSGCQSVTPEKGEERDK